MKETMYIYAQPTKYARIVEAPDFQQVMKIQNMP